MISVITRCLMQIKNSSGRNDKAALLKKFADVPGFKEVLHFLYNPYDRTSIGLKKLAKYSDMRDVDRHIDVIEAIAYFKEHPTGTEDDCMFAKKFIKCQKTDDDKEIATAICVKKFNMGVTDKTLRQVYGDEFIARVGIMLGEKYFEFKDKVEGPYIATEKLDGHRRLLIKENGKISMFTRSGLPDEGLVEIEEEAQHLPDNCVYDGEGLAKGVFKNALEQRQATNSIMNSKGIRRGITFNIFDSVPLADFKADNSVENTIQRKVYIGALFGDISIQYLTPNWKSIIDQFQIGYKFEHIKSVPILGIAHTEEDILAFADPIWVRGFEGVMLNTMMSNYRIKRTKELLKVKATESHDLVCIDIEPGKPNGRFANTMGNLVVDYKGYRVGVGSGFDDALRNEVWNNKDKYIGRIVEVDTFGETTPKGGGLSLNCAIFRGFRFDK